MNDYMQQGPDTKTLRIFGLVLSAVLLCWLVIFAWVAEQGLLRLWFPSVLVLSLACLALLRPRWLGGFHRRWMQMALWLNRMLVGFLLGVVFFLLLTPIALVMRRLGKDALSSKDCIEGSYRQRSKPITAQDMEEPF